MRKFILVLVGISAVAAARSNAGTINPAEFPADLNLSVISLVTETNGTVSFDGLVFKKGSVSDYGPGYRRIDYTLGDPMPYTPGASYTNITIFANDGPNITVEISAGRWKSTDEPGWSPGQSEVYYRQSWGGSDLGNLSKDHAWAISSNVISPPEFDASWFGGLSPSGMSFTGTGGTGVSTNDMVASETGYYWKAQALSSGLVFTNGSWTVPQ